MSKVRPSYGLGAISANRRRPPGNTIQRDSTASGDQSLLPPADLRASLSAAFAGCWRQPSETCNRSAKPRVPNSYRESRRQTSQSVAMIEIRHYAVGGGSWRSSGCRTARAAQISEGSFAFFVCLVHDNNRARCML